MLTKKDFIAVADMLKTEEDNIQYRRALAERFADLCAKQNPRFDRARFFKACGL